MWYVYFLELSNGNIYVGSTSDLKRRFESHQKGQVLSTKVYCPVKLRAYVAVENEDKARELEKYFKSGSGKARAAGSTALRPCSQLRRVATGMPSTAAKACCVMFSCRRKFCGAISMSMVMMGAVSGLSAI